MIRLFHPKSSLRWREALLSWSVVALLFGCVGLFFGIAVSQRGYQQSENVCTMVNVPDVPVRNLEDMPINIPVSLQLNKRQIWFLKELKKGEKLKTSHLTKYSGLSEKTSKRDIRFLMEHNLVEYVGSRKTGYYRIVHKNG